MTQSKKTGDRAFTVIVVILVAIVALYAVGAYRDHQAIADCQAQGGIPLYKKAYREMPNDSAGNNTTRQEYQVFDRCGPGK